MMRVLVAALAALLVYPSAAIAQRRFALIVSGAAGADEYRTQYAEWSESMQRTLTGRLKFDPSAISSLSDTKETAAAATAVNVRSAITGVRRQMQRGDLLLVLLMGHGTFDGTDAKFNLVGPDLQASEWADLLANLPGQVIVVNTTAGSFPFIERLSGPRRIVISATDSIAQRFDTVFAEYFIKAFEDMGADLDKNQRTSIWEAFAYASAGVKRHYQQRGQLETERALLEDDGDGVGKGVAQEGEDGATASRTYLDETPPNAAPTDEALLKLLQRKALLEAEVEELRIRKAFLPAPEYAAEFERLMIDLARVSSEIRKRVKT